MECSSLRVYVRFVKNFPSFGDYPCRPGGPPDGLGASMPAIPAAPATATEYEGYNYEPPKGNQLIYPMNNRF